MKRFRLHIFFRSLTSEHYCGSGRDIPLFILFLGLIAAVLLTCVKLKISNSSVPSSFMYFPIGSNLQQTLQIQLQISLSHFGLWLSLSGHWGHYG
jgi:hypothetical protein